MSIDILMMLAAILVLAVGGQWLAWRMRLPSILVLLFFGFLVGPIFRFIQPDAMYGDLLFPLISVSVGIILFEGGLNLHFDEIDDVLSIIGRLISLSALVTWGVASLAAYYILALSWPLACLLGAILIVTGPTVVGPLLRQIRPLGKVSPILKWEGVLIDPVGAVIAVLVFEAISHGDWGDPQVSAVFIATGLLRTVVVGSGVGMIAAGLLLYLLRQHLVPDYLQNALTLMVIVLAFAVSNSLQDESGLLTTTLIGLVLANQSRVSVRHIAEFTENVQVILLGSLFILLSARVALTDLLSFGWAEALFIVVLIVLVRPLAVSVATVFSSLGWREWLFMSWLAPRGIVAAAVSSIFAFELMEQGYEGAERIASITFLVIITTVIFYGFTAGPVARWLGLSEKDPQGVLIVGAHQFAQEVAATIQANDFRAVLLDTNRHNITHGRMQGLETYYGNALSEHTLENLDLAGVGRLLAMTGNNEVNSLAALHFPEIFGRAEVYQLPTTEMDSFRDSPAQHLHGRFLFHQGLTYGRINVLMRAGATIKTTQLTDKFDYASFMAENSTHVIPLFVIRGESLLVFTCDQQPHPEVGDRLISLVTPEDMTLQDLPPAQVGEAVREMGSFPIIPPNLPS
jgi:NhaP-type Na+/H+ or K+/H+ antiporter